MNEWKWLISEEQHMRMASTWNCTHTLPLSCMLACTHAHIDAHTQHFGQDTEQFSSASRKACDYLNIKVLLYRGKITKDYCTARCYLNCFPVQLMQANFKIKISSKLSLTLAEAMVEVGQRAFPDISSVCDGWWGLPRLEVRRQTASEQNRTHLHTCKLRLLPHWLSLESFLRKIFFLKSGSWAPVTLGLWGPRSLAEYVLISFRAYFTTGTNQKHPYHLFKWATSHSKS